MQRAELRLRFTDSHPALVAVREKLEQLNAARQGANNRMKQLPEAELELARLMRDVQVANELYLLLLNKAQELKVVKSGTIGNVRIIDSAVVPRFPVRPRKARIVLLSVLAGLGGGFVLARVRQTLSRAVADPDVVERETGLAVFAAVPRSGREVALASRTAKRVPRPVLADTDPDDLAVESLRSLRTSLQFVLVEAPSRVLTILGPSPGVGKTFCAVNLAYVLAEQNKRVALVDADLRKGRLHKYLDGVRGNGLSEVISGGIHLEQAIRRAGDNVDIISSGKTPPNPAALLASDAFQRIVSELAHRYDFVLLDTPPVLAVTDATVVARLSGVNLLVVRAGRHPVREIALSVKRLEQGGARVHGAVMNDMSTGPGHNRYYYYYQYKPDRTA
jgi:tyrosine-protein kinase Etk/Wzc